MGGGASKPDPLVTDARHFKTEIVIGQGGFGKVNALTKKTEPCKKKMFAVKEMEKMTIIKKNAVQEVFDELRFLEAITFPLICNAQYAYQNATHLFLVLDICLGGDLQFRLNSLRKQLGPNVDNYMQEDELRYDFFSVLGAMNFLHENKIIYRDTKPANILVEEKGTIKLTDFGISKYVGDKGTIKCGSGTPGFMAPELFRKSTELEHGYVSDIWAFGITMYEMYSGKKAFSGEFMSNCGEIYTKGEEEVDRVSKKPGSSLGLLGASEDFVDLINKCVHFDPEKRITSAEAMKHPFWKGMIIEDVLSGAIKPVFLPDCSKPNFDTATNEADDVFADKAAVPKPSKEQDTLFEDFKFDTDNMERRSIETIFGN